MAMFDWEQVHSLLIYHQEFRIWQIVFGVSKAKFSSDHLVVPNPAEAVGIATCTVVASNTCNLFVSPGLSESKYWWLPEKGDQCLQMGTRRLPILMQCSPTSKNRSRWRSCSNWWGPQTTCWSMLYSSLGLILLSYGKAMMPACPSSC
jgi:hypothetical protein